jgi:alpha-L-fucosidase 2
MTSRSLSLLVAAATLLSVGLAQAIDDIDWQAFLSRHDPVWNSSDVSCFTGYTLLQDTIKHESAGCDAPPCASADACVETAATACDACTGCTSFGLSPAWRNGTTAQLFGNVTPYIDNPAWSTFVKGGPLLRNHSRCSVRNAPLAWEDGPWLGNGLQGSILLWDAANPRALRLDVGRADVWDRRAPGSAFATGSAMFDRPRLPTGVFSLNTSGVITHAYFRVHLAEGVARGRVTTTLGAVDFLLASLVPPREHHLLLFNASGGEVPTGASGFAINFIPQLGDSTRQNPPASYKPNPPPSCAGAGASSAVRVCTQPLLAGAGYATAYTTAPLAGAAYVAVMHTANDWPADTSAATAEALVRAAAAALAQPGAIDAALEDQAAWWLAHFKTSFLSIPNTALEGAWVLQVAKIGAATRAGGIAIDLMGPWWQRSGWELYWYDMNVPVTYWMLYAAGHFDLAATLTDFLLSNTSQLSENPTGVPDSFGVGGASSYDLIAEYSVTPGAMLGNFPWICHNLYSHASFTGNDTMMRDVVYPLLRGAINVYKYFHFVGEDALIHLPASYSPEYPYPRGPTNDTHYDMALFFWGAKTLISLNARFNLHDPLLPFWESVVATLAPYPTDPIHGYNVSLGVGFDVPHRHFSHLFAIFPLHNIVWSDADGGTPASRDLIARSLDRWTSLTCVGSRSGCPNGFTYDGAISMSALMTTDATRREDAAAFANGFVHSGLLHASTSYSEGHQPCLESPLGLASGLQDILLQSWGGRVRVFPAAPASWTDAVFYNLAAEGGLRVSAARVNGTTAWAALTAEPADASGALFVNATLAVELGGAAHWTPAGAAVTVLSSGDLSVLVPVGGTVVVYGGADMPAFTVSALAGNASEFNFWGLH